ncbi:hypothetical protein Hamer_G023477 [Homarus americanus]|uniref:Uncharacterized protein n=1 Tax=Homarus americanus TaxID=6706 RepID=A0A8J5TKA0_HOMAM|nr:hypothetical protein Hamer_G023477 [Homarus americanus]
MKQSQDNKVIKQMSPMLSAGCSNPTEAADSTSPRSLKRVLSSNLYFVPHTYSSALVPSTPSASLFCLVFPAPRS